MLTSASMDEILWCYHSNETSSAVLSHGTIHSVCGSNFCVYGGDRTVLPFQTPLGQKICMVKFVIGFYSKILGIFDNCLHC